MLDDAFKLTLDVLYPPQQPDQCTKYGTDLRPPVFSCATQAAKPEQPTALAAAAAGETDTQQQIDIIPAETASANNDQQSDGGEEPGEERGDSPPAETEEDKDEEEECGDGSSKDGDAETARREKEE